jgi:hypothetical protein
MMNRHNNDGRTGFGPVLESKLVQIVNQSTVKSSGPRYSFDPLFRIPGMTRSIIALEEHLASEMANDHCF